MDRVLPFEVSPASARVALTSRHRPRNCVWELTLDCNLNCVHCGSSAGRARHAELSTEEALDVVRQLRDLGCELVTLSGGEPLLRPDWFAIARAIADSGMYVNMVPNGLLVDDEVAAKAGGEAIGGGVPEENRGESGAGERRDFLFGQDLRFAVRRYRVKRGALIEWSVSGCAIEAARRLSLIHISEPTRPY